MVWFRKSEDVSEVTEEPSISPDTEASMWERVRQESWFAWAWRVLAVIVVVLIVLFGVRAIHHHIEANKVPLAPANTKEVPAAPNGATKTPSTSGSSSNSSSTSSSKSGSSTSSNSGGQSATHSEVPNTGPGDTAAIFAVSAAGAAGLHYVVRRKQNQ